MPPKGKSSGRRGPPGGWPKSGKGPAKRSFRGGRKFNTTRLDEIPESESDISEDEVPSGVDDESVDDSASEHDEKRTANQAYLALMQSLTEDSAPSSAKRRKLHHGLTEESDEPPPAKQSVAVQDSNRHDDEHEGRDVDLAEEPEADPADDTEEDEESEDDHVPDMSDPFETHFAAPDTTALANRLRLIDSNAYQPKLLTSDSFRLVVSIPGKDADQLNQTSAALTGPSGLKLKYRLVETAQKKRPTFDKVERLLYPVTFGYQDLLFCGRTVGNAEHLRRMTCLHAVNHVFKTRDRVIKNNAKITKQGEDSDFEPRDQGFTRPKVLMLLPTRESAVKVVEAICTLCEPDQQENRKRFDESYVDREVKFSDDRPADFRELFEGNDDDMFRLGIKFTRKTIKYFSQFYNSDILLASPLGLRMAIGSEEDKKKIDSDFLSSIEVVVVDQADALLMQNWEHVEYIFEHLNRQPKDAHGCDFSRVREWYLDNQASYYRQTLILSAFNTPELAELHRRGKNWAGRFRVQPEYGGVIQELGPVKTRQTFSRFEASSIAEEPDARFAYFTSAVMPSLVKLASSSRGSKSEPGGGGGGGTLIFIPSYLDFVRVRNYFATSDAVSSLSFGAVSEYADVREASRARSHFLSGRHKVLLYTERAHHFRRYVFSGVRRIVMYGMPDNPLFYAEMAGGFLAKSEADGRLESGRGAVRVLFSKFDALRLERVAGSKRVGRMIREKGDTFDFI